MNLTPLELYNYLLSAIICVVLIALFVAERNKRRLHEKIFEDIARHRNGKVIKSSLLYSSKLNFYEFDCHTEVFYTPGSKYTPPATHFKSKLRLSPGKQLAVYRETPLAKMGKLLGLQDIRTFDEVFDKSFLIKGTDLTFAQNFLTVDNRQEFRFWEGDYPVLYLLEKDFHFKVNTHFTDRQRYDQFIASGLKLLKRVAELG